MYGDSDMATSFWFFFLSRSNALSFLIKVLRLVGRLGFFLLSWWTSWMNTYCKGRRGRKRRKGGGAGNSIQ